MRQIAFAATAALLASALPAAAQYWVDVPIWGNGILSQQALSTTFDNYDREHGIVDEEPDSGPRRCSVQSLPTAEKERLEADYVRRVRQDGQASADAWAQEQGRRFRNELISEGSCPDSARSR